MAQDPKNLDLETTSAEPSGTVWDRVARDFDRIGPRFFSHDGRRLVERARIPSNAQVLDVATGRGAVLFPAAERCARQGLVVGIDLSAGMLRETAASIQQAGLKHVAVGQMDAGRLAFRDAVFDRVLSGHGIIFFPHAIGEFFRVLRPGGQIGLAIVVQECHDWLLGAFQAHAPPEDPPTDEEREDQRDDAPTLDSPTALEALLKDVGFEEVWTGLEDNVFIYTDEDEWWSNLWTLGFRRTLERMTPMAMERLKADIYQRLQDFKRPDGVHILFRTLFVTGAKPR